MMFQIQHAVKISKKHGEADVSKVILCVPPFFNQIEREAVLEYVICSSFSLSLSLWLNMSQSCCMVSTVLYFYYTTMIIYILYYLVFKILSSFVRDSSYHNMYYKGCGLLCAHKKSFNTAIPVRSLGPYMYVH